MSQKLNCFPPSLIGRPFSHLGELLSSLTDFPLEKERGIDVLKVAKHLVLQAVNDLEKSKGPKRKGSRESAVVLKASSLLASNNFKELRRLGALHPKNPEINSFIGWSFLAEGNELLEGGRKGGDRNTLERAIKKIPKKLPISLGRMAALSTIGVTLFKL